MCVGDQLSAPDAGRSSHLQVLWGRCYAPAAARLLHRFVVGQPDQNGRPVGSSPGNWDGPSTARTERTEREGT